MPEGDSVDGKGKDLEYVNENEIRRASSSSMSPLALRMAGYSFEEIGSILELPGGAFEARKAVDRALELHIRKDPDAKPLARELLAARLDKMMTAIWPKALNTSHPDQLAAQKRVLDIVETQARLMGLNAPTEVSVVSPSMERIEQVAELLTQGSRVKEKDIFGIVDAEVIEDEDEEGEEGA